LVISIINLYIVKSISSFTIYTLKTNILFEHNYVSFHYNALWWREHLAQSQDVTNLVCFGRKPLPVESHCRSLTAKYICLSHRSQPTFVQGNYITCYEHGR